jgi:hypothetical protein
MNDAASRLARDLMAYLVLWAMFLLTRWRQTYQALSVFGEEMRYYLID